MGVNGSLRLDTFCFPSYGPFKIITSVLFSLTDECIFNCDQKKTSKHERQKKHDQNRF